MQNSSVLSIDLSQLHHNLHQLTHACGHLMVMVKANAYGTDPLIISEFLQSLDDLYIPFIGVSHVTEGVYLRQEGITKPIFVISAPAYEAESVAAYQLTASVSSFEEVEALNGAGKKWGRKLAVHLHLDTGMKRFGISIEEGKKLYQTILASKYLALEGVMTHFAAAELASFDAFTGQQIEQFKQFIDALPHKPRWVHAANSAGAVRFSIPFCNLARIGLGCMGYGACLAEVKPIFKLTTRLASIHAIQQGESVGYSRSYTFQKKRGLLGVIPFGYYDGFLRAISGKGYVLIGNKKAPILGTICMDFMMVDLTDIPEAEVGQEITLFGPALSPDTVASWAQTDVREILVHIPSRVKRHWANPPSLIATGKESV